MNFDLQLLHETWGPVPWPDSQSSAVAVLLWSTVSSLHSSVTEYKKSQITARYKKSIWFSEVWSTPNRIKTKHRGHVKLQKQTNKTLTKPILLATGFCMHMKPVSSKVKQSKIKSASKYGDAHNAASCIQWINTFKFWVKQISEFPADFSKPWTYLSLLT